MIKLNRIIAVLMITIIGSISRVSALTMFTFKRTKNTAEHGWTQIDGSYSFLDLISVVNSYLWFFIGFFCFIFMIWNGYKLISANGDEKAMDSAKKALLGSVVGIVICLLAYVIVNLAVKLFA